MEEVYNEYIQMQLNTPQWITSSLATSPHVLYRMIEHVSKMQGTISARVMSLLFYKIKVYNWKERELSRAYAKIEGMKEELENVKVVEEKMLKDNQVLIEQQQYYTAMEDNLREQSSKLQLQLGG